MKEHGSDEAEGTRQTDFAAPDPVPPFALFVGWLRPATWAPLTRQVSLRQAFPVHILGTIGCLIACMIVSGVAARLNNSPHSPLAAMSIAFRSDPFGASVGVVMAFIAVETACLFLACLVMPWATVNEPPTASFTHAIRHVWLHTTHAIPLILVCGVLMAVHDYSSRISDPTGPGFLPAYGGFFVGYAIMACSVWFLWAMFRAAGAPRPAIPTSAPPICEYCGYNLTGAVPEGRCPECGVPVAMSLGSEARAGTACDRAEHAAFRTARRRCWRDAILRPATLGRQIQVSQPSRSYRRCLAVTLLPIGCAVAIAFTLSAMATERTLNEREATQILLAAPMVGAGAAAMVFAMGLIVAALVGGMLSSRGGRNLRPVAMQMQCYLGGFLLAWSVFACLWTVLCSLLVVNSVFVSIGEASAVDDDLLAFLFWSLPCAAGVLVNVVLVWKGTSVARYANR